MIQFDELQQYQRYSVIFKDPALRLPRRMVAVFLGFGQHGMTTLSHWSGRPAFGTTDLPQKWFVSATPTTDPPLPPKIHRPMGGQQ